MEGLGTPHYYTASSQDVANRFAASALLYGSPALIPIPDLQRTSFLLMVGANPFVSHGSVLTAPKVKEPAARDRRAAAGASSSSTRGAPRPRAHFEHVAVRPDSDAWLLLSMLCVLVEEGLADEAALARETTGWARCARAGARHSRRRRPRSAPASPPRTCARSRATSPPPTAPPSTGAPARAWAASARSSRSCSTC